MAMKSSCLTLANDLVASATAGSAPIIELEIVNKLVVSRSAKPGAAARSKRHGARGIPTTLSAAGFRPEAHFGGCRNRCACPLP
jgi:hypothetical protein